MTHNHFFEYPLNEKVRNYLRVESLYLQLIQSSDMVNQCHVHGFFRALFDLNEVLERSDWRVDLLKDLQRQQDQLNRWAQLPGVDTLKIQQLLQSLSQLHSELSKKNKLGYHLQDDKFLGCLRQRFSLPGGACSFDLPQLHYWQNQEMSVRQQDIQTWIKPYQHLGSAVSLLLQLMREQAHSSDEVAENGFYQGISEGCEMLRIEVSQSEAGFPTISGHKSRFALRFMTLDNKVKETINFKLFCCKSAS